MQHFVIAITRKCGCGGTTIGQLLADELDVNLYDRELLQLASEDSGIHLELFEKADERMKGSLLYRISKRVYGGELIPPESNDFTSDENLFNYQAKVLRELARDESYIVIGRAADFILKGLPNVFSFFLFADESDCVARIKNKMCYSQGEAMKYIKRTDKFRSEYYTYHTGQKWEDPLHYDLSINTSKLGVQKTAKLIQEYIKYHISDLL